MCLTEEFETFLREKNENGIIVSDTVHDEADRKRRLSSYQDEGTPYPKGISITRVIDSMHFVESCASPLIQLADIATHLIWRDLRSSLGWEREISRVTKLMPRKIRHFN